MQFLTINTFEPCRDTPRFLCMVASPDKQWIVTGDNVLVMLTQPEAQSGGTLYAYELFCVFLDDVEHLEDAASCDVYIQKNSSFAGAEYLQNIDQRGCTPYDYLTLERKSIMTLAECLALFPAEIER